VADPGRRWAHGVEIDPLFGVITRRYYAETGREAVLEGTGETFDDLAARRRLERPDGDREDGGPWRLVTIWARMSAIRIAPVSMTLRRQSSWPSQWDGSRPFGGTGSMTGLRPYWSLRRTGLLLESRRYVGEGLSWSTLSSGKGPSEGCHHHILEPVSPITPLHVPLRLSQECSGMPVGLEFAVGTGPSWRRRYNARAKCGKRHIIQGRRGFIDNPWNGSSRSGVSPADRKPIQG
jgi:hypothetical protein